MATGAVTISEMPTDQIAEKYGGLIERGIRAFTTDPQYVVRMAEQAALAARRAGAVTRV